MDKIKNEMKENSNSNSNSSLIKTNGKSIQINQNRSITDNNDADEEQMKNDLFLKTYEKPTQIYRFLRTRHTISPVLLHRNLSYMKFRMSTGHIKKENFKLDSMLSTFIEKNLTESERIMNEFGNLIIRFSGIQDNPLSDNLNKSPVDITVCLLKINTKNSNNSLSTSTNDEIELGECKLNFSASSKDSNKLTISRENFSSIAKYVLVFKVTVHKLNHSSFTNGDHSFYDDLNNSKEDVHGKKRRNNEFLKKYRAELNIIDSNQVCLLKDGEYNLTLTESKSISNGYLNSESVKECLKKIVFWEKASPLNSHLNTSLKNLTQQGPCLNFFLNWSTDLINDSLVHQPPIMPSLIKNNQQPLKQIEATPNTESKFSKNSKKFNNTNGVAPNDLISLLSDNNCKDSSTINDQSILQYPLNQTTDGLRVIFRFYLNNICLQQTKSPTISCPWCDIFCKQILSLKNHLKYFHSRFNFKFSSDNKGYKVDVFINESYDGSYCGNPQQDLTNFSFRVSGPVRRTPVTHFLVNLRGKARKFLSELLDNESMDIDLIKPHVCGHDRLYYHSGTCQPIKPHELDNDSEDEKDPEWMRIKTQFMIDEFTDVNEGEKEVMKLWNLHMMKYNYVGGCHVPLACEKFIHENWREIINRNIYMNFVLHLNNLFDFGLLTSSNLRSTIKLFHKIKDGNSDQLDRGLEI